MIPVFVLSTIVRTVGQYILIKAGGEAVKSIVEIYTPIPVVSQPSLCEQVVKVVVGSASAAGAGSVVSKYLGGGNKQVKRIDDLETKLGEEVKGLKEGLKKVRDETDKNMELVAVKMIEGVNVELEEERMINSLYRAINAYLEIYIKSIHSMRGWNGEGSC